MSVSLYIKNNFKNFPMPLGKIASMIPYELRPGIGNSYRCCKKDIIVYEKLNSLERKKWIFKRVKNITNYAAKNIPFYKNFYRKHGFNVENLRSFDDIPQIPTVKKSDFLNYELQFRSTNVAGAYYANTGGSSGKTLSFYLQDHQMGTEWAHIHHIWKKLGYKPSELKLMFVGRTNLRNIIDYDFVRHSFVVDIYADFDLIARNLMNLLSKHKITYLHGYPSAIYEFVRNCEKKELRLLELLKLNLKGAFLSSEYPMPLYRQLIERLLEIPTVSFYGHTEHCVIAYEKEDTFVYVPLQTYGYAEAVSMSDGTASLIGTCYNNFASPFIRYNTEDQITSYQCCDSILNSFKIESGRNGQFVIDRMKKNIPLTGLIFGRHHKLFEYCTHIQIYQNNPGYVTVLYVPMNHINCFSPEINFDISNVDLDFSFKKIDKPIKTVSGKINILVSTDDLERYNIVL